MISYARNGEDVVLARALGGSGEGFYIDLGAGPPERDSVTRHFYEAGWRGVDVAASPHVAAQLREARPRDVVIEAAFSASQASVACYVADDDPATFTTSGELADGYRRAGRRVAVSTVRAVSFADILAEAGEHEVDFLRIDAEGDEAAVVGALDWTRLRPRVLVVLATVPGALVPSEERFDEAVRAGGYARAANDGVNAYYLREEDAALAPLLVPANVNDDYVRPGELALRDEVARLAYRNGRLARELAAARAEARSARARAASLAGAPAPAAPRNGAGPVQVSLDRLAVVSSPGTGAARLAAELAGRLGVRELHAGHPADLRLADLADRAVVEVPWKRSDHLHALLSCHGFRPVTIARHPFDVLLEAWRERAAGAPAGEDGDGAGGPPALAPGFVAFATGEEGRALLLVSASWWEDPGCLHVRYEELEADPSAAGEALFALAGFVDEPAAGGGREAAPVGTPSALAPPRPDWRAYLTSEVAEALYEAHRDTLRALGFAEPLPATLPEEEEAAAAWRELVLGRPA